ncbi:MAG: hypothetical protein C3F13_08455 [Anaerolineales bacterium]|nr:hypothetical protein [Anaerolineae bacterium]PWB53923.1 MAG: hypothetical protein C3F13_08455 [Anaerolineales bacterium]
MKSKSLRTDLPVIVINNLDPKWSSQVITDYDVETHELIRALSVIGHPVIDIDILSNDLISPLNSFDPNDYIVFNWCEELPGVPHSEYLVAEMLEHMGYTFTGADSSALSLGQDKCRVKHLLQREGIPIPQWNYYMPSQEITWEYFPAIVKAAFEHCSYGISRESVVMTNTELYDRVNYIYKEFQQPAIVEEFIDGQEFHIGVVGNGLLHVLPPAEIDFSSMSDIHDRLCTFEANYEKNSFAYSVTMPCFPARLTQVRKENLEKIVISAYRATSCRDYARMDVRLRDGVFYVLDVNHNADISCGNSLVLAAELDGYSYGQFGSLLVNLAAQRHPSIPGQRFHD